MIEINDGMAGRVNDWRAVDVVYLNFCKVPITS